MSSALSPAIFAGASSKIMLDASSFSAATLARSSGAASGVKRAQRCGAALHCSAPKRARATASCSCQSRQLAPPDRSERLVILGIDGEASEL
eukprot:scaffold2920_cov344-Pinguiococcus_pyrenoidosus.AAC.1